MYTIETILSEIDSDALDKTMTKKTTEQRKQRLGMFFVPCSMIASNEVKTTLAKINFVPVRVEQRYERDSFMMIGLANVFEEIGRLERAPEYEIIISEDKPIRAERKTP